MEERQLTRWDGNPVDKAQLDDVLIEMERIDTQQGSLLEFGKLVTWRAESEAK
jgi:hypothetical protein